MPVQVANQQPNYFIGGLSPFSKLFKQLYFNFKCQSIDAPGDVNEFIRQCLKEFFTNSHISDALKNRNYILTSEEYPNLNKALQINVFDDCFDIFLRVYFKSMEEYLKNNTDEHKLIEIYKNEWSNFHTALSSLTKWKEFFFNDQKPSSNVPLAVRRLIKQVGEENAKQVFTDEILNSYKILGVYQPNETMFNDAFTCSEFVKWHQPDFEHSLPSTSHANIPINQSQPSNEQSTINNELLKHEIIQNQENFINDSDQLQTGASISPSTSTSINVSIQPSDLPIEEQVQDELELAPNNVQPHNAPEQANNLLAEQFANPPAILFNQQPAQRRLLPFGIQTTENTSPEFKLALQQQLDHKNPDHV
uniref:Uncharacterized protein n=1 Tax=Acrobeloides nanus TaxID=290746 RepID=A0A914E3D1_9BILA